MSAPGLSLRAPGGAAFTTTHWSVVVAASVPGGPAQDQALASLCAAYWLPVYGYIRRRGNKPEDAQDLTQEFFARLLAKEWLTGIEPNTGRFRSFLLTAVARFLANEYDRGAAAKRGGGWLKLNLADAEEFCAAPLSANPEQEYDRQWALTVMDQALVRLGEECRASNKAAHFDRLSAFLSREPGPGEYEQVAAALGLNAGAVGVSVLRLRRRYRELVRAVIAETVSDPAVVEDELSYLVKILRS